MSPSTARRARAAAVIVSATIGLAVAETALRSQYRDLFYVWTPYTHAVFELPPGRAPGIQGQTEFTINRSGLRGDDFGPDGDYRVLAIGASTTECLTLDDAVAWPRLAQELVNARGPKRRVWIGNAGRAGLRMSHHELQLRYLLPEYPRIDAVILLVGINDVSSRLAQDAGYRPANPNGADDPALMRTAFQDLPRQYRPGGFFERTETWRLLRTIKRGLLVRMNQPNVLQDRRCALPRGDTRPGVGA